MGCRMCSERPDQIKIVIGGLSRSGKTVIFFKLTDHPEFNNPVPTIGYNSEIISYRNKSIIITDIGSKQPSRASISTFVGFSKGFIFVIDTSQKQNLQNSRQKFNEYLEMKELNKLPILFYLNYRDNSQINESEVVAAFELPRKNLKYKIQNCNAVSGEGVSEGFEWLIATILQRG